MVETLNREKGDVVRYAEEVEPVPCPCGSSTRIITSKHTQDVGFHITHIQDSKKHYHKKTTEIYYILEGSGVIEIGDEQVEVRPGATLLIKKGTPHRGYGDFKTIVVTSPAFDPEDEYLV